MGTAGEQPIETACASVDLATILSPERIASGATAASKKRVLDTLTDLLCRGHAFGHSAVCRILNERERLGSTGIGHGVALPHGRVASLDSPVGAFVTLHTPVDFDAPDGRPVSLVFALLVPEHATATHLQILAHLARLFGDEDLRRQLASTQDDAGLYRALTHFPSS